MRIVGGRLRGRRLEAPGGMALRPTADRTREALFNILCQGKLDWRPNRRAGGDASGGNPLAGARALDLPHGIETGVYFMYRLRPAAARSDSGEADGHGPDRRSARQ